MGGGTTRTGSVEAHVAAEPLKKKKKKEKKKTFYFDFSKENFIYK